MQRYFSILTTGNGLVDGQIGFGAYGLLIDNNTNQWLYEDSQRRFVPPYQAGVTVPLAGAQADTILFRAPGAIKSAAPIAGEYVNATYTDQPVVAGSGIAIGGNRGLYFDRNPRLITSLMGGSGTFKSCFGGNTVTFLAITYVVPNGRMANFSVVSTKVVRVTAAATPGDAYIELLIGDGAGGNGTLLMAFLPRGAANNGVGAKAEQAITAGEGIPLTAGQTLNARLVNTDDAAGQVIGQIDMLVYEFDSA